MAVGALAVGSGSPAWVTVVAAAVTGLLGLGAGASAAAIVTARQQTIEVFRNRMIEAADKVVARLAAASGAADYAQRRLSELEPEQYFGPDEMRSLRDAAWFRGEMEPELARLYVVFPDPIAADLANDFAEAIKQWIGLLENAHQAGPAERISMLAAAVDQGDRARVVRDTLLREMNDQIRLEGKLNPLARRRK